MKKAVSYFLLISLWSPFAALGLEIKCKDAMSLESDKEYTTLRRKADGGDACAQLSLSRALIHGDENLPKNIQEAIRYNRLSAKSGLDIAQHELAITLMVYGETGEHENEIIRLLQTASEQGLNSAKTLLGEFLITGRYTEQDIVSGLRLIIDAKEKGDPVADQLLKKIATALQESSEHDSLLRN